MVVAFGQPPGNVRGEAIPYNMEEGAVLGSAGRTAPCNMGGLGNPEAHIGITSGYHRALGERRERETDEVVKAAGIFN